MRKFMLAAALGCGVAMPALAGQEAPESRSSEIAPPEDVTSPGSAVAVPTPRIVLPPELLVRSSAAAAAPVPAVATPANLPPLPTEPKERSRVLLARAVADPYDLAGLSECDAMIQAVTDLDIALGPDIDLPLQPGTSTASATNVGGMVARRAVGMFIPFGGLLMSAANSSAAAQRRRAQAAVQAGLIRRGFLKGVGGIKGCAYPARPAPAEIVAAAKARADEAIRQAGLASAGPARERRRDD